MISSDSHHWKTLGVIGVLSVLVAGEALANPRVPPGNWRRTYKNIDFRVSDEFNAKNLNRGKWTLSKVTGRKRFFNANERRNNPGRYVGIRNRKYAYINGLASTKRGGGFAAKSSTHYGFSIVRWKTEGLSGSKKANWVPAWWATFKNFGEQAREVSRGQNRLEVDLVEVFGWENRYSSHPIAWLGSGPSKPTRLNYQPLNGGGWKIHGVDYTPDGIAFYRYGNRKWNRIKRVPFVNGSTTRDRINKSHRKRVFWQAWMGEDINNPTAQRFPKNRNATLLIDYFLHYPRK